jgi:hypothetical protein
MSSFIRYLAYADDFNTVGLVYTSSQWHWAGDGKGTVFDGFTGPATSSRWTGTSWIQGLIGDYAQEYPNFVTHDRNYPSPLQLLSVVRVGNTDFPGETTEDTPGSNLIKRLLLDNVPGPLYLQTWGGLNTIVRALKSIQADYENTPQWPRIYAKVSRKAVIEASGFQDCLASSPLDCGGSGFGQTAGANNLNDSYLLPNWPDIRVVDGEAGYFVWGYPHFFNDVPASQLYYSGAWIGPNIKSVGPLGNDEYTWDDGHWDGDPGYTQWDDTSQPEFSFVSEGDNVAFLPLIDTGLQSTDPTAGGWGGRNMLAPGTVNDYVDVPGDIYTDGTVKQYYDWERWFPDAQNDFAARLQWGVQPASVDRVSEPAIEPAGPTVVRVQPGEAIELGAAIGSPTGEQLTSQWWQYRDAGTYPGAVTVTQDDSGAASLTVPSGAQAGQTIVVILQVTTASSPSMTHYARFTMAVE